MKLIVDLECPDGLTPTDVANFIQEIFDAHEWPCSVTVAANDE